MAESMTHPKAHAEVHADARSLAGTGHGPLLQRDYWAVLDGCELTPTEIGRLLAEQFEELAPPELVHFRRAGRMGEPLAVGDELRVHIRMAGDFGVCVVHQNARSITLGTLRGHPEAGRITFGAYRNVRGQVVFHIRSHARASTTSRYAGFLVLGEAMQTNCWTDFIDRLAHTVGRGVIGAIHEDTQVLHDEPADEDQPTFLARGSDHG